MRTRTTSMTGPLLAVLLLAGLLQAAWAAASVNRMTKEDLQKILGEANTVVLDVRQGRDWDASEFKIMGARRADPGDFDTWAKTMPKSAVLVLYCA